MIFRIVLIVEHIIICLNIRVSGFKWYVFVIVDCITGGIEIPSKVCFTLINRVHHVSTEIQAIRTEQVSLYFLYRLETIQRREAITYCDDYTIIDLQVRVDIEISEAAIHPHSQPGDIDLPGTIPGNLISTRAGGGHLHGKAAHRHLAAVAQCWGRLDIRWAR